MLSLLHNKILYTTLLSYITASVIKIILKLIRSHQFDASLFFALGGMPSAHSATVSSLAMAVGLQEGFSSAVFTLAFVFALVTMRDACGVRAAVSKQANILDYIANKLLKFTIDDLDKVVGHTPTQVFVGSIVGIVVAIVIM